MKETPKAATAWADYLAMGEDRSLDKLAAQYRASTVAVPTRQLSRLKRWSTDHDWQGRLRAIADRAVADTEREMAERRREAMTTGLANDFERVRILKALAQAVLTDFKTWTPDVKMSASGKVIEVQKFNDAQLNAARALLDDIAKELGGRSKKLDVTSGGNALKALIGIDPDLI